MAETTTEAINTSNGTVMRRHQGRSAAAPWVSRVGESSGTVGLGAGGLSRMVSSMRLNVGGKPVARHPLFRNTTQAASAAGVAPGINPAAA